MIVRAVARKILDRNKPARAAYMCGDTMINDRRTPKQLQTHRYLVTATDRFMSGWGIAEGGLSKVAWACSTLTKAEKQLAIVKARSDMKNVRLRTPDDDLWKPKAAHLSIYVVK